MKRNYLMASMLAIAAIFTGCSEVDEFFTPNTSKTYEASVIASKEKVEGLWDAEEEGTRAVFVGGNNRRFATLWDEDDVVRVYKDGVEIGTMSLNTTANKPYQGTKDAYLSGTLTVTGNIQAGDDVTLYLTSRENLVRPYTGQTGSINDLSKNFSYQTKTVKVASVDGNKITLEKANMDHQQAYLRFVLTDEEGNRLHPQQLIISADPIDGYDGQIVTSVAADNSEEYGDLVINAEADCGEYPGELFVAVLNENDNAKKVNYHLTVINEDGVTYTGPNTVQVNTTDDRPCRFAPPKGELNRVWRKLAKVEPTVELGTQMKMVVGTKRTRVPVVKAGETVVPATCTYTSSNYAVASVNASTGEVMALSTGTATITVNIAPYGVSRTYTVTVIEPITEYVDLGLSVNWAKMNIGAESETDYGTYFCWGEVDGYTNENDYGKNEFGWPTYKWAPEPFKFSKYVPNNQASEYGYNGFYDNKSTLDTEDDAAAINWGSNWRMATFTEWTELNATRQNSNYVWQWQTDYLGSGHKGILITWNHGTPNDPSDDTHLFLPAAGDVSAGGERNQDLGLYYSSTLYSNVYEAYNFVFGEAGHNADRTDYRTNAKSIRAVCPKTNLTLAPQMKILQGTKKTRKPVVTVGSTDVTSQCTFTYSSNNYSVARVSPTGEVTGVTPGTATITVTSSAPYVASTAYTVTVTAPVPETYAVDLGLSVKWATMNIGAESETDYGTYFCWGEVDGYTNENDYGKNEFGWPTYKWAPEPFKFSKYVPNNQASEYGYNGFYDNKSTLDTEDDAAAINWGSNWRMATFTEWTELNATRQNSNYVWQWQTDYLGSGHKGILITWNHGTPNDPSDDTHLFLPAAGDVSAGGERNQDLGLYYSSTLYSNVYEAYNFVFGEAGHNADRTDYRTNAKSIRAVWDD